MSKNKKFRLYWKNRKTGKTGHGTAEGEEIAQAWVERMDEKYPDLEHWYESAPAPEADGQQA